MSYMQVQTPWVPGDGIIAKYFLVNWGKALWAITYAQFSDNKS